IQGNVIEANDSFCRMLGYTQEEVVRLNVSDWDVQFTAEELKARVKEFIDQGSSATFDTIHRRKDGSLLNVEVSCSGVNIEGGQFVFATSRDITERKLAESEIHSLAFYDVLTHLPNRRLLMDRLNQTMALGSRNGLYGAILFLDLDNFKALNDTKGHDIGDLLLFEVAKRLQGCVREGDTVGRFGGDEFVLILEGLSSKQDEAIAQAEIVAEKVRAALGKSFQLGGLVYHGTTSIGINLFLDHSGTTDELFKQADVAMYQAKQSGRNAIRFFDPAMQAVLEARSELEAALRGALSKQQFSLHYQIQVDAALRPIGAEALLRWQHPDLGMVPPVRFIPLAEETGLIVPIGQWVLESACAQIKLWEGDPLFRDLNIAVNVSAREFRQESFVAQIKAVLDKCGIKPNRLKLELTESLILHNVEDSISKMQQLKSMGVDFSMDDFGTGFSSLSYLKRLPLDQIKIDQSFVRDISTDSSDAAIVQTIIAMAETLGLKVIAEGVETEAQREFLDLRGCPAFQGYLFSRPVPVQQFERLVATWEEKRAIFL
ncbi:MAG: EAL domain-containing protein, partial [Burkholderiales bacterium]